MRRFIQKTVSVLLVLALAAAACCFQAPRADAATVNKTLAEAQAWMDSKLGTAVNYDGSGSGVQCVDLARMYSSYLGADLGVANPSNPTAGVAADYIWQSIPAAYTRYTNSQTTAQAGDIFVNAKGAYGASANTGHVGLVHHVSGNNYYIIDYGNKRGAPNSYTKVEGLRSFSVVIRPNFKSAAFSLDVNGLLDGAVSGDLGDYGTFSITVNGTKQTGLNDYYNASLTGSVTYSITDIKATQCHKYEGVSSGSLSGTVSANTKVALSFTTAHTPLNVAEVPATCTQPGVSAGQRCSVCGKPLSGFTEIPALKHSYLQTRIPATCTEDAVDVFTCARCGESYRQPADATPVYGEWTAEPPAPGENQTVETKTQYRYADKLPVWTKTGGGTIDYAASWPAGFSTSSPLYAAYNVSPKKAGETETSKIEVTTSTVGWIYWHWCRSSYAYGPINRTISSQKDGTHVGFHAFYSTADAAVTTSANARRLDNKSVCTDTYWWIVERVEIRRCSYTEYVKTPGDGWGEWSDWGDGPVAETDGRRVETRTLYRLKTETPVRATGHRWNAGEITAAPTCRAEGERTFTCTVCGASRTAAEPMIGHTWDQGVVTLPATADAAGVLVYTCLSPGCGEVRAETIPAGMFRLGDVDNDGSIASADARLALRRSVDLEDYAPGSAQFAAADVDRDHMVTAADARKILRAAVSLENAADW